MRKTVILIGLVALLAMVPGASATSTQLIAADAGIGPCRPAVDCAIGVVIYECNWAVYTLVGGYCYHP